MRSVGAATPRYRATDEASRKESAMAPRMPTRQEILELLGSAAEQAKHAEDYHAAAADPAGLQGRAAHQAAREAGAMQLIELAGCAEGFKLGRGDPNTTLERLDHALRPFF